MQKLLSSLVAAALVTTFAAAVPVNAAPMFVPKADAARTDVQQVKKKDEWYKKKRAQRAERQSKRYSQRYRDDDAYYYDRRDDRRYERDYYDRRYRDRDSGSSFNLYLRF